MARPNSIWWWESRGEWAVNIKGVRHRLGEDEEEAKLKFHAIMAKREKPAKPVKSAAGTVPALMDQFLDYVKEHNEKRTYKWYLGHLQSFRNFLDPKDLLIADLKPSHVYDWADSLTCGATMKRGAMTAVARVFNWAVKRKGIIEVSPIAHLEKPSAGSRELVITPDEYDEILKKIKGGFRDLVLTAWETGARPQEITRVEARHVDLKNSRWVFPVKESKGKKRQRIVYLTDTALEITKRLTKEHPTGAIFRNRDGEPWTPFAINCNFLRLQVEMGRQEIEIPDKDITARMKVIVKSRKAKGKEPLKEYDVRYQAKKALLDAAARKNAPKYCLYAFRHSYCTNGLKNGTDPVTMGKLMGHADLTMIYKIYAQIAQDPVFMLDAARKVK